jgi:hypothetical protein
MLIEQTLEKMNAMKLVGMTEALRQQLGAAHHGKLSFDDRLGLLVEAEWLAREQKRLKTRLHAAKLRYAASLGKAKAVDAVIEPCVGGRWYERGDDGSTCEWGRVLSWAPPSRIVLSWEISADWRHEPSLKTELERRARVLCLRCRSLGCRTPLEVP